MSFSSFCPCKFPSSFTPSLLWNVSSLSFPLYILYALLIRLSLQVFLSFYSLSYLVCISISLLLPFLSLYASLILLSLQVSLFLHSLSPLVSLSISSLSFSLPLCRLYPFVIVNFSTLLSSVTFFFLPGAWINQACFPPLSFPLSSRFYLNLSSTLPFPLSQYRFHISATASFSLLFSAFHPSNFLSFHSFYLMFHRVVVTTCILLSLYLCSLLFAIP